jgi:hypothetical protein
MVCHHNILMVPLGAAVVADDYHILRTGAIPAEGNMEVAGYMKHTDRLACRSRKSFCGATENVVDMTALEFVGENLVHHLSCLMIDAAETMSAFHQMVLAFLPLSSSCLRGLARCSLAIQVFILLVDAGPSQRHRESTS